MNGDFIVDDAFRIRFSLMRGPQGMFVSLPGRYGEKPDPETGKKVWYSEVFAVTDEIKNQLNAAVLNAYALMQTGPTDQARPTPTHVNSPKKDNTFPF
jgi:DNA-binding cell septation regulator SpoVG